ncbi:MAG: hypothetical protein JSW59_09875, partial [Phycisphaerales bacterium]
MSPNSMSISHAPRRLAGTLHAIRNFLTAANSGWLCAICLVLTSGSSRTTADAADATPWWNSRWHMRLSLTVDVGPYERQDKPVEQFLNFKTLLASIGRGGETVAP